MLIHVYRHPLPRLASSCDMQEYQIRAPQSEVGGFFQCRVITSVIIKYEQPQKALRKEYLMSPEDVHFRCQMQSKGT